MPMYQWRGQSIEAPSLAAVKKYIQKQHLDGLPLKPEDDREEILNRMKPYIADVYDAEDSNEIPRGLLKKLIFQESRFREDIISGNTKSSKGAIGIAQFMPATAKDFDIDPTVPEQAIPAAAQYLRQLHDKFGQWDKALAAYNWGMGNVERKGLDKAPKETKDYYSNILADLDLEG